MIQYQESPWQYPCPLPIPDKPLAKALTAEEADRVCVSPPKPESHSAAVLPDDDYSWMILL